MTELLAAILRGDTTRFSPLPADEQSQQAFLAAAHHHRIEALLAHRLCKAGTFDDWPDRIRAGLVSSAREAGVSAALADRDLRRVLAAIEGARVPYLLLKGAPIAYTHYPDIGLRPRLDADLMIRKPDLTVVMSALEQLGYHAPNCVRNESTMHQLSYCRADAQGIQHTYDIHWKISNRPLVADFLTFDELRNRAVGVPPLGEGVRALGSVDALLLACVHRVAHHNNTDALIWLYDIHLLASGLTLREWDDFARLAAEKRVRAICARGLALAQYWFHTPVGPDPRGGSIEPSADYLRGEVRHRHDVWLSDLRSLPTWQGRWQLVRDVVFPDSAYMFRDYGQKSRSLLPFLYGHRFVNRTWRLMRHALEAN
jgi:hypothetical protein